ncbi:MULTISPECIES: hypothetical protein [Pseudanabaena]|jgi:hypothetical protein|uniref:hypothetical protein n=1 Tax=Pseudanabaena TaxID=1152 RepID=UPI00247AE226|nr:MULTISPECIES: hypothetical protein [Pseudanabaena]MEA5488288.1 hypothetical protein [Pseudanabaena sp. CCNP1317]WGS72886.1 hypothetical protein OA858_02335 [Pseudanabaena galeata CCNP1313]
MSICRLCGLEKQLIKAHIIPRKLYEPIREASIGESPSDQVPRMYVVGTEQKSKQFQSGIYDTSILCKECDGHLIGVWDNYGQKFLLNPSFSENRLFDNLGKLAVYRIEEFDYKQLKLFFMSILWRAAITSDLFFAQIKLGSWEEKLRKMILSQEPGSENDFSVVLFKYEGDLSEIMQNPTRQRQDKVNYYRFRFPKYGFLIKVDQRNFHSDLLPFVISPNHQLLIHVMEYKNSKEYERILDVRDKISN